MDLYYESDDKSSVYNSDEIDSETEVRLYGAIHHMMATEDQMLVTSVAQTGINLVEDIPKSKPIVSEECIEPKTVYNESETINEKPLKNLFELLDTRLDQSDEEFFNDLDIDFRKNVSQNSKKRKVDVIEIDDSSDSDVVIIEDNFFNKRTAKPNPVNKQKSPQKPQKNSSKPQTKIDISLGNVDNLSKTTMEVMNEFYNEDNYDSEEEANNYSRMSSDKSLWKVSHSDLLLSHNKNNRYYKNKFICNNCNERGHFAKDCPLPKKTPTCFLCGWSGHRIDRCRSVLCSICLTLSHKTINCKVSVNQLICDECGVRGHETNQCTYNWRKFHLTTTSSSEEPMSLGLRPNKRKCCYNCGAIGKHFGFECHSKSMERRMIPVSVLMPNTRKAHCFNGRNSNNRRNDCPEKALFNEFEKSISSNELSRLSASFNKPLDHLDLEESGPSNSAANASTTTSTFNKKNKHIKWIYPENNGSTDTIASSYSSALNDRTPFIRKSHRNRVIAEPTHQTILYAKSTTALNSAHTLTPTRTHQQINNSMQEKTQTTPQLNERSKRRKRKKRKTVETDDQKSERQPFKPNASNLKPFHNFNKIKAKIKRIRTK